MQRHPPNECLPAAAWVVFQRCDIFTGSGHFYFIAPLLPEVGWERPAVGIRDAEASQPVMAPADSEDWIQQVLTKDNI